MNNNQSKIINLKLSEIVNQNYKAAIVFERFSLDFCCDGNRTLKFACEEKHIDPDLIVLELNNLLLTHSEIRENFNDWTLDFLASHIVKNHHDYIRCNSPIILEHGQKLASVYGKTHPQIIEINKVFSLLSKELNQHMMKEEQILFPYIDQMAKASANAVKIENPFFGTVRNPIRMMENDHQSAGEELFRIKSLTENYTPPEDTYSIYMLYYKNLREFENDLHKHIHLENNILFPKAIELEKEMMVN